MDKEKLKLHLRMIKHNLKTYKDDLHINEKFYKEKNYVNNEECYTLSQNCFSLKLLFSSLFFDDAKICFIVEAFNYFQDLEENILYESFSQSLTTFILEQMKRKKIIDGEYIKRNSVDLKEHMEMLGNYDYKKSKVTMYSYYFYKLRSFAYKDIPFIKKVLMTLNIDISNIIVREKNNKIYLKVRKKVNLETFQKLYKQKENIIDDIKSFFEYFYDIGIDEKGTLKK